MAPSIGHLYAVLTKGMKVVRVMRTEKGAKKYATQRGHTLVGRLSSPGTIDRLHSRCTVQTHFGTSQGWCRVAVINNALTVFRGKKAIANHFMEVFHG